MTTRSKQRRPNSAVYLGTDPLILGSTPPGIPDLPEPPSPVSSNGSGLPSPPATNSTGSGSTGDPASIALRNTNTKRSTASMLNADNVKKFHSAFTHEQLDDYDDNDHDFGNENDEDDTARLNRRHSLKPNENTLAIQRALSLKERTKMTIDKLSSYSRMNTPSPSTNPRHSLPSFASDSSSSSSSRRQKPEPPHSGSETEREQHVTTSRPATPKRNRTRLISAPASPGKALLGITSTHSSSSNSSHSPSKPRKRASMGLSEFTDLTSGRRIRSPDTYETLQNNRNSTDIAQAALAAVALSRGKVSPTNSKRRQPLPKEFMDATASGSASGSGSTTSVSRRGSLSNSRQNGDDDDDDRNGTNEISIVEPSTPHHSTTTARPSSMSGLKYLQLSPRQQRNLNSNLTHHLNNHSATDPRPTIGRSSTLRRHQTGGKWVSEDMSSVTSSSRGGADDDEYDGLPNGGKGRVQTMRAGGSAESALTIGAGAGGRSLIGQGLKAAGLSNGSMTVGRRGGADVFDDTPLRDRDRLARDRERAVRIERIERSMSRTRSRSRAGWDDEDEEDDEEGGVDRRRPESRIRGSDFRTRAGTVVGPRAATSMAEYRVPDREREGVGGNDAVRVVDVDNDEPRTAPPQLRTHKSTYDLPLSRREREPSVTRRDPDRDRDLDRERERDKERERTQSSLSRYATVSTPFGTRRLDAISIPSQTSSASKGNGSSSGKQSSDRSEHTKLLQDSLRMFETHVSRIPSTSSATGADLLRNAQSIVNAAEKLNALLRVGTVKALDAQIESEVDAATGKGESVADVWRWVGGEYREGMRYSDELVRSVTDFLLGVGRAVKDMSGSDGHGRSISLDEEGLSLGGRLARSSLSPDVTGGSTGSGKRSTGSRKSWSDDLKRLSTGSRQSDTAGSRPSSALNLKEGREAYETPPAPSVRIRQPQSNGITSNGGASSSVRRLLSPREIRDQQAMHSLDSQETVLAYEPSPTPAARNPQARNPDRIGAALDRSRTLPPISIPQPLSSSEAQSRRQNQTDKTPASSSVRRRPTISGAATVRGSVFPSISPNVPTTALTPHTVSNSPERSAFPMLRADSNGSGGSGSGGKSTGATPRSTVTFSRSSTVSALTGLQQAQQKQHRQRTISTTSSNAEENDVEQRSVAAGRIARVASGSETERDIRRSTVADRARVANDGFGTVNGKAHPADRSAASSIFTGRSKERRKSVVDVWSRGGGGR